MRHLNVTLAMFLVAMLPTTSVADGVERLSLVGLPGVYLLVQDIGKGDESLTDEIRTAAELALRRSGIRILTRDELDATRAHPILYVNFNVGVPGKERIYASRLSLMQNVVLATGRPSFGAITWYSTGLFGLAPDSLLRTVIREDLERMMNAFCNDFLIANPPRPQPTLKPAGKKSAAVQLVDPDN